MGRLSDAIAKVDKVTANEVEAEIEEADAEVIDFCPDNMPADVWELVQENGRLATERLNELLLSSKFPRMKASDQAKLIALAQDRAYGKPISNRFDANKRRGGVGDVTQRELNALVARTTLPEYKRLNTMEVDIDDAEEL